MIRQSSAPVAHARSIGHLSSPHATCHLLIGFVRAAAYIPLTVLALPGSILTVRVETEAPFSTHPPLSCSLLSRDLYMVVGRGNAVCHPETTDYALVIRTSMLWLFKITHITIHL